MNRNLASLVGRIRQKFPRLDIRTDQCDVIRVYAKRILVGVEQQGHEYVAKIVSLEGETDFDTTLRDTLRSENLAQFEDAVLTTLERL